MAKKETTRQKKQKTTPGSRYPLEFKMKAMELLQENSMNMRKTSKQVGVSFNTICVWREKYLGEIEKKELVSEVAGKIVEEQGNKRLIILEKIHDSKIKLLDRLQSIADAETNMDKISNAIKVLSEIDGSLKPEGEEEEKRPQMLTLIETLTQNFNKSDYESKTPITIIGDIPKQTG